MDIIYLDNNATTRPAPQVVAAMHEMLDALWANPSSVHRFGQQVRQRLELARASVAQLIGCRAREVVFTSGGTESNNLAIFGVLHPEAGAERLQPLCLVTTPIEHSAVREPAEALEEMGGRVVRLRVDEQGVIDLASLEAALAEVAAPGATVLVSVQWANNETGVIQPVERVAAAVQAARDRARQAAPAPAPGARLNLYLHLDATQAVGKLPVDVKALPIDMLTLAAHKLHGPKGVGALYVRTGVHLRPIVRGGPQEREKRGGTENASGVVGMGMAAELAGAFIADHEAVERQRALRDRFERGIVDALPDTLINSGRAPRLWNTSNLAFPGVEAEAILLGLSERGVCASAGAACSSGSLEPSPVLLAMGLPEPVAHGSVRFSLSRDTTAEEVDRAVAIVPQVVRRLRQTMPMGA